MYYTTATVNYRSDSSQCCRTSRNLVTFVQFRRKEISLGQNLSKQCISNHLLYLDLMYLEGLLVIQASCTSGTERLLLDVRRMVVAIKDPVTKNELYKGRFMVAGPLIATNHSPYP